MRGAFPYKAFANQKFQKFCCSFPSSLCSGCLLSDMWPGMPKAGSGFRITASSRGVCQADRHLVSFFRLRQKQSYIDNLGAGIAPPAIITLFICALVAAQPDVGTAFIIALIALCIILCSGFSGKTLLKLVLLAGIVLVLVSPLIYFNWDSILTEGRMKRFESYQNPFKDAGDSGFQVVNSYLAIGSGDCSAWASARASRSMGICLKRTPILLWRSSPRSSVFSVSFCRAAAFFHRFKRVLYSEEMR